MQMDIEVKFSIYEKMLREWNSRMNLVAPSTLADVRIRHIDDSLQLAEYIPMNTHVIDLGSGAGFPAVVLAILGYNVTCIESISKKCAFLNALKSELNLPNLTIINDRIENFVKTMRCGKSVVFTARAFASLEKIFDMTGRVGAPYALLKGENIDAEITTAREKYKFEDRLHPSKTGPGFIFLSGPVKLI